MSYLKIPGAAEELHEASSILQVQKYLAARYKFFLYDDTGTREFCTFDLRYKPDFP